MLDGRRQIRSQRLRPRRRYQPAPLPHEEWIAEEVPQARQRIVHRRRRDVQLARRGGGAAFAQDHVQHQQQIEVDTR
jgi:hypothetical protein